MNRLVTETSYEWDIESYDGEDIFDHNHSDKLPTTPLQYNEELVLVKNVGEGVKGDPLSFDLKHRSWAYVKDGVLPMHFDDGHNVPKRFHKELEQLGKG